MSCSGLYVASFDSIRSARKGFTSPVIGSTPKNWQASAVVPDPPKGSSNLLTGISDSAIARATISGGKASLKCLQFWNGNISAPALVPQQSNERPPVHCSNETSTKSPK